MTAPGPAAGSPPPRQERRPADSSGPSRRAILGWSVGMPAALALAVAAGVLYRPARAWYLEQQTPVRPTYLLSPDFEKWNSEEIEARARRDDLDAEVRLAELKIRSCGGIEVRTILEHVLSKDPDHVRANLHLGTWLLVMSQEPDRARARLMKARDRAPRGSAERVHACQMLNWMARGGRRETGR